MDQITKIELETCLNKKMTQQEIVNSFNLTSRKILRTLLKKYGLKSSYSINSKRKYTFNENFFETIDTEEKAYWLGFIAADGCIKIHKNTKAKKIQISLSMLDYSHIMKFKESIQYSGKINKSSKINKNGTLINFCRIVLNSTKMYNDLIDKGIVPRKSLILKPPKNVPQDLIKHWIRGYFDGDGCVHITRRGYLTFNIIGTYEVLIFISDFYSLNLKIQRAGSSQAYLIRSQSKAYKFLTYIYHNSNIYLNRKYNVYNSI